MLVYLLAAGTGLLGGLLVAVLSRYMDRIRVIKDAEGEAKEWLDRAKEVAQTLEEEAKVRLEEYQEELSKRFETDTAKLVQRNNSTANRLHDREENLKAQSQSRQSVLDRRQSAIDSRDQVLRNKDQKLNQNRQKVRDLRQNYRTRLAERSSQDIATLKEELIKKMEVESKQSATRQAQLIEEESQHNVERQAKHMIRVVLNRFARPYCPERGIGNVSFEARAELDRVVGPNRSHLGWVEKACGVDISLNEEYLSLSVLGFDPVRRELGRAVLERLTKERQITEAKVNDLVEKTKRELFRKITSDGQRVARELNLKGFHPEVVNMLGALRYRYSFAQNQHFHCAEVGWLCGLLSSEMGVPVTDGRRSGLLHDIGKAMDHSKDGGHAVIGADFIEKHNEPAQVVHAVRAHHFDEQPGTDLAYLVIAADAISGARPGARRSTIDSYTQKMADLEKIARSFEGVIATYILSAGREVRVVVDSASVDDHKALELSKSIAHQIEEECSYPGLIRVTVLRETQAVEFAR